MKLNSKRVFAGSVGTGRNNTKCVNVCQYGKINKFIQCT